MEILSWNECIQVRRIHESLYSINKGGDSKKILTPSSPNTVF
jgi:hypothetical protein